MSNLSDVVGGANLFGGLSYSFVPDRLCSAKSAIYFNRGYLQVPEGVYFSGDFTFTAWIYLKSYQFNSRIFDFGNGQESDNVVLAMFGTTSQIYVKIIKGSSVSQLITSSIINLNEWYFISFVLSNTTGLIYINGNQVINGILKVPNNIKRKSNYIGKSDLATDSNADAKYGELKIYQEALSSVDIMNEYKLYSKYGILNYCPSNHWQMSTLSDAVGGANLFEGANYSFVPDRFCSAKSAIYFNQGYLQVPAGVYFSGDFTFTAWIYLKSFQYFPKIFDFGNEQGSDNVALAMVNSTSQLIGFTFDGSSQSYVETSSSSSIINLYEWNFISFVLSNLTGYVYINRDQVGNGTLNVPNNKTRTKNYIGKSYLPLGSNADAIYDELKIYQEALSSIDIMREYSNADILNYCPSNYWPMSSLNDVVGGANLFEGISYSFVPDRFCSAKSAIYFNQGYLQVPAGVYFSGNFTVTAWIYLKSYQSWSRIFDFGNGQESNNVVLAMVDTTSQMTGSSFKGSSRSYIETSSSSSIINLNEWYFISFVLNGTTGYIYVNANQVATNTLNVPNNITRKSNYIGKSNLATDSNADAIYDELKIYQGALSSADIMNEYKKNSKNGNNKLNL
jgi:hypothetical protein